jgi:predicted nucleic acid-binding protein
MVIVDTSVWFDYFAGVSNAETGWLDVEVGKQRLGVTDLILCEILQGTRGDREFRVLKGAMLKLRFSPQEAVKWPSRRLRTTSYCGNRGALLARPSIAALLHFA